MCTIKLLITAATLALARSTQQRLVDTFAVYKGFAFEVAFLIVARLEMFAVETVVCVISRRSINFHF